MSSNSDAFYLYLKHEDESWDVKKYESIDGELEKEYHITPSGQCSCKGYQYNNHCKHVEAVVNRFTGEGIDPEEARAIRDEMVAKTGGSFGYEYEDWVMNDDLDIVGIEFTVENPPEGMDAVLMWGRHEDGVDVRFNLRRQAVA